MPASDDKQRNSDETENDVEAHSPLGGAPVDGEPNDGRADEDEDDVEAHAPLGGQPLGGAPLGG
jgi:hypothetical protein